MLVIHLFSFLLLFKFLDCARILAIFPYPGPSQYINAVPYLKKLASRGHQVDSINAFPQKQPVKNFQDIPILEVFNGYEDLISDLSVPMNIWAENNFENDFFLNITEKVLKNKEVQRRILPRRKAHYDLIILEALRTDVLYAFGAHFNAPIIGLSTFGTDWDIDKLVGNTSPISYIPLITAGLSDRMTYCERLINFLKTSVAWFNYNWVHLPRHVSLYNKYFPHLADKIPLSEISKNISLVLLNQHFSLSFPRPYVPNMIEVGGLHIAHKPAPLPKELEDFIQGAGKAGVIYFSLGSNVKSKDLPEDRRRILLQTFASLPQRVLWKFELDHLPDKPDNVFISKWFPQPDILAHPQVKLFITHGGLLSTIESIHHGKPILGLPFFYDQFLNIARAERAGFGLGLSHADMTATEFKSTLERLLNEPKYAVTAQEISARYRDQPMTPQETAVWWTEYILRHKGATYMRVAAQDLNFFAYHSLDVLATLIGGALIVIILILFGIRKFIRIIQESNVKQKTM